MLLPATTLVRSATRFEEDLCLIICPVANGLAPWCAACLDSTLGMLPDRCTPFAYLPGNRRSLVRAGPSLVQLVVPWEEC
jgi:hypothetical protein